MKSKDFLLYRIATMLMLLCFYHSIDAQCYPDRHNLTLANSWISCEPSASPNTDRGTSHWIMYDLGQNYDFGTSHFWNLNLFDYQDDNMRNIAIDVSFNGSVWTEAATYELAKADISGFYEGEEGPDLQGHSGRYILITALDNYGGDCYGLSELKVSVSPMATGVSVVDLGATLTAQPSPFADQTVIDIHLQQDGLYQWRLTDSQGRLVLNDQVSVAGGLSRIAISGDGLVPGVYLFTLSDGDQVSSLSLVKQ